MDFHKHDFYSSTSAPRACEAGAFLRRLALDPYIRLFVSACAHSRHGQFVDPRHIGRTARLGQVSWGGWWCRPAPLRRLSADFTELLTLRLSPSRASRSIREDVSGRYPVIPPFRLRVHLTCNSLYLMQSDGLVFLCQPTRRHHASTENLVFRARACSCSR